MEMNLFALFGKIAGFGGLSLAVVLVLFGKALSPKLFPDLSREHAYRLIRLVILCTAILGLAGMTLGTMLSYPLRPRQVKLGESSRDTAEHVYHLFFSGTVRDGVHNLSGVKITTADTTVYTNERGEFLFRIASADSPQLGVAFRLSKAGYPEATRHADIPGINQPFTMSKTNAP